MKKILRVFLTDAKRMSGNVVAIVVIMGLSVIPALYAWFNILSNWDPYGEEATSAMHIAVYSQDEGIEIGELGLNVGDTVVSSLEANDTIGWIFTESKEDALKFVYSGECYAAIIVPEDFSEKIISFLSGEPVNPAIEYYENSKKNAIAAKITSKVKNTVQQQVNSTFVGTLAEVFSESGELLTAEAFDGENLTAQIVGRINEMDTTLDTYANVLQTLSMVTTSASDLVDSANSLIPSVDGMAGNSQDSVGTLQKSVISGAGTAQTVAMTVDVSLEAVLKGMDVLSKQLEELSSENDISNLQEDFGETERIMDQTFKLLEDLVGDLEVYKKARAKYETLKTDLGTFSSDAQLSKKKLNKLAKRMSEELDDCQQAFAELKNTFDNEIVPSLNQNIFDVEYALVEAQMLLGKLDTSFVEVQTALESYSNTLGEGTDEILAARDYVVELQNGLHKLVKSLNGLTDNEQYQKVASILQADPAILEQFLSSPVEMETEAIYEIETYGSAMAPFYTVLGLWVGALILVALIHVKVHPKKEWEIRPHHAFFGRYITFFLVGQMQTLLTILGDLLYIHIQCEHPVLFWLAGAVTSFVFTLLIYSLTVAFGNVGEAIAVVIMVIQVAGAGGTFPVEVLPDVYQAIYKFLPFTYSMNAMRECVGGMYRWDYWKDLGVLGIYVLISLFIGLVLRIPFVRLNARIERSKERSGLMI